MSDLDSRRSAPRVPAPRKSHLDAILNVMCVGALIWMFVEAILAALL